MSRWRSMMSAALVLSAMAVSPFVSVGSEVDRILEQENKAQGVKISPAPIVDDLTYLRRVYVDLIGRIPTNVEINEYLALPEGERRTATVDKLLADGRFADRWTTFFADMLRLRSTTLGGTRLIAYVHEAIRNDMPYDELCRRLIRANGKPDVIPEVAFILGDDADPLAMAAVTAQVFLGVRMSCAQCHDHPFDVWTREDFYGLAAYYGKTRRIERTLFDNALRVVYTTEVDDTAILWPPEGVGKEEDRKPKDPVFPFELTSADASSDSISRLAKARKARELALAKKRAKEQTLDNTLESLFENAGKAKADGSAVNVALEAADERNRIDLTAGRYRESDLRAELANLVTSPRNRYFSRAFVNRMWGELVGRGFVEPIDDFREDNPPSHPKTLDYLADEFVASGYSLKSLIRMILTSETYQRAHAPTKDLQERLDYESSFLATSMRRMISEALYDSIVTAGHLSDFKHPAGTNMKTRTVRTRVAKKVDKDGKPTELASIVPKTQSGAAMPAMPAQGAAPTGYDLENAIELDFGAVLKADGGAPSVDKMNIVSREVLERQQMMAQQRDVPGVVYEFVMVEQSYDDNPVYSSALRMASPAPDGHFLRVFGQPGRADLGDLRDADASMRQALMMLNGRLTHEASRVGPLETMYNLLTGPKANLTNATRLAYREILTREPSEAELTEAQEIISAADNPLDGMADLRWVLLNCNEFRFLP